MKACQLDTTFYLAAVNDKSVPETLRALQTQSGVADSIATHQGADPATLQEEFIQIVARLAGKPLLRDAVEQRLPCIVPFQVDNRKRSVLIREGQTVIVVEWEAPIRLALVLGLHTLRGIDKILSSILDECRCPDSQ
jgi:hypothetical protein